MIIFKCGTGSKYLLTLFPLTLPQGTGGKWEVVCFEMTSNLNGNVLKKDKNLLIWMETLVQEPDSDKQLTRSHQKNVSSFLFIH